ncbi:MAG: heavy metal translocating P-type ATPase [Clostridia bacterium]|nr:heavy metal translocating P-type ATPase [Clostridia bacterium]
MKKYNVTGMSCAACSARVEKAVSALSGVDTCAVNLLTNSMTVEGSASPEEIIAAVEAAGYGASAVGEKKIESAKAASGAEKAEKNLILRLFSSLAFLAVLMYVSMGHVMWGAPLPAFLSENPLAITITELLLSAVVMVINQKFFINGTKGIISRAPNMDSLVALGSGASFIYSTAILFKMTALVTAGNVGDAYHQLHDLYFESAAMILALITVGKMLEAKAKGKTTDAIQALMDLAPKTATIERNGNEISVPIDEINSGDIFIVRPGEHIAVDGVVISGRSAVDESALTGESIPCDKEAGSKVSSGTLNLSGVIRCEATHVGEDTTLSQIIKMVSDAAATKAPIAKVADKVSGIFVPVVMTIAIITTAIWLILGEGIGFALARGISVLVISCPCALGLATPVAIMVGTGIGAKNGILFKNASALETTGKIKTVVFDKTGTITSGNPAVTDIIPADNYDKKTLMSLAASLEKNSEHPLAKAVMAEAEKEKLPLYDVTDFEIHSGNGLKATINGDLVCGGNFAFVSDRALIPEEAKEQALHLSEEGKTPLFFSTCNKFLGIVAVRDTIKEDSIEAINELHNMGISVVMLTGDNETTANAIGKELNLDRVIAGVLPDGKEKVIRQLMEDSKVAMVGDGINDAPALTRADIGIAIGAGTDIAIDAADIVLVNSSPADVPAAIRLSRKVLKNIHENLFWAFFYNAIGIPVAAGALSFIGINLSPMLGAAAMSLSSFCVVSNALRLNLAKIKSAKALDNTINVKENNTMEKTMKIEGMMCPHCSGRVKKTLEAIENVTEAIVSHENGTAIVKLSADVSNEILSQAVTNDGYTVISVD